LIFTSILKRVSEQAGSLPGARGHEMNVAQ